MVPDTCLTPVMQSRALQTNLHGTDPLQLLNLLLTGSHLLG